MCEGCNNGDKHSSNKKKLKYWNRRVIKHSEGKKAYYQIHEVYYSADKIEMWTENAIRPGGESLDELIEELKDMLNIANYAKLKSGRLPVLNAEELPREGKKNGKQLFRMGAARTGATQGVGEKIKQVNQPGHSAGLFFLPFCADAGFRPV